MPFISDSTGVPNHVKIILGNHHRDGLLSRGPNGWGKIIELVAALRCLQNTPEQREEEGKRQSFAATE